MGGVRGLLLGSNPEPAREGREGGFLGEFGPVRVGFGPEEQARAGVEPGVAFGAWGGAGNRPAVLLRAVDREGGVAVSVHGRGACGDGDGGADVRGRGAPDSRVAAVQACVRVEGVAGSWVREARVGRTCHRFPLPQILQGLLVRCLRHSSRAAG